MRRPPAPASASRLRWIGRARLLALIVAVLILSAMDRAGWLLADRPDADVYHLVSARVTRIIDGDTIEVDRPDTVNGSPTTRVRLVGIDCPEIAHPEFSDRPAEPFADEAAKLTRSLVLDQLVVLRIEPQQTRDRYGRLLAHVDLPDGSSLAEALLSAGLARREDRWNHTMLLRYRQLELAAHRAKVGMWQ